MNSFQRTLAAMALSAIAMSACAPAEDITADDLETRIADVEQASTSGNGLSINGLSINGMSVNGLSINGLSINGSEITGVLISGTELTGYSASGSSLRGLDFAGATVPARLSDGTSVTVLIEKVEQSTVDPELWYYRVSYENEGTITYPCGLSNGAPIAAIALTGRWDESAGTASGGDWIDDAEYFTFACEHSTLEKCTGFGYKPWAEITESDGQTSQQLSLRDFHQACTRMIRADYCGDGTPHTMNGVPINLWDNFGLQTQTGVPETWKKDAEWSADGGSVCIQNLRYDPNGATTAYVTQHCPDRLVDCFEEGSTFFTANGFATPLATRALIRNEFDYEYVQSHSP